MEFSDVARRVFAVYDDASFGEALDVLREVRPGHPERDSTLTFWEACLLSLTGRPEQAIDALDSGLDRGLSWHPRMLADPDLDAARELEQWPDLPRLDQGEKRSASLWNCSLNVRRASSG